MSLKYFHYLDRTGYCDSPEWKLDIVEKKLPVALYRRLGEIMTAFKKSGERTIPEKSWNVNDMDYFSDLLSPCTRNEGQKNYRFYGLNNKLFGMSPPNGGQRAAAPSWPVCLEMLFDALKEYCRSSGESSECKIKEISRLCDETAKLMKGSISKPPHLSPSLKQGE